MSLKHLAMSIVASGGLIAAGCDKKDAAAPVDPAAVTSSNIAAAKDAAASDMMARAQGLYDEAKDLIAKGDFKNAQADVDQLNTIKSKLPADWQAKVDEVTKLLAAGKGKLGGMSVPAMPK